MKATAGRRILNAALTVLLVAIGAGIGQKLAEGVRGGAGADQDTAPSHPEVKHNNGDGIVYRCSAWEIDR